MIRPGDTIFIASVFSLYMESWGTLIGSERLGAKSFPFGAGAPGMSARAVHWLHQIKPTAFYGTPSYALHLAEVARGLLGHASLCQWTPGKASSDLGRRVDLHHRPQHYQ